MSSELKACPFCGTKAKYFGGKSGSGEAIGVSCYNPECRIVLTVNHERISLAQLATAWNIRAQQPDAVSAWLPIETYNKKIGEEILLYTEFGIVEGSWDEWDYDEFYGRSIMGWCTGQFTPPDPINPTHWMPLPIASLTAVERV